jgi:hypothetical protein
MVKAGQNLGRAARCAETDRACSVRMWLKPMPHESAVPGAVKMDDRDYDQGEA